MTEKQTARLGSIYGIWIERNINHIAVNDYFDRQERMKKDHYLETREKEDAFLDKVLTTIEQGLKASSSNNTITNLLQPLNAEQPKTELADNTDEYADTALDFADSF